MPNALHGLQCLERCRDSGKYTLMTAKFPIQTKQSFKELARRVPAEFTSTDEAYTNMRNDNVKMVKNQGEDEEAKVG